MLIRTLTSSERRDVLARARIVRVACAHNQPCIKIGRMTGRRVSKPADGAGRSGIAD
jgi:hypothetical protein